MLPPLLVDVTASIIESLLYGLYIATTFVCLQRLLYSHNDWKPTHLINWPLLVLTVTIFVTSTLDMALSIRRSVLGILGVPPSKYLWSDITMSALVHTHALLADGVLMYRCWIVSLKSYSILIFPAVLWSVAFGCAIARAYWQPVQNEYVRLVKGILTGFWLCTIILNVYATSLIAYRITTMAKIRNQPTRRVRFAMRIIIESGMLYTMTALIVVFGLIPQDTATMMLASAINFQSVGIASNLIIIRATPVSVVAERGSTFVEALTTVRLTSLCDACTKGMSRSEISGVEQRGTSLRLQGGVEESFGV
ncbi:hypothetical protein M378DRAFT_635706 [Amanita muscaria Koide BX008]|uniref:Uncharacterized protein n=1 Tax=Amanita muscaria (strain Koide BX008) TaxID=946122 RepID=A0A0C2SLQ4_AMAMK|nr:hypothetical protein M378DRAFT_635706 [Amanita muscaria Koide BX008]